MNTVETSSKLLIACWATVILILAMALIFFRGKRRHYGTAILPLVLPPLMHLVSGMLSRWLGVLLPFANSFEIRIVLDLAAAVAACVLIGLASTLLYETRKGRALFILCCSVFIVVFSGILIMNTVLQYGVAMGLTI